MHRQSGLLLVCCFLAATWGDWRCGAAGIVHNHWSPSACSVFLRHRLLWCLRFQKGLAQPKYQLRLCCSYARFRGPSFASTLQARGSKQGRFALPASAHRSRLLSRSAGAPSTPDRDLSRAVGYCQTRVYRALELFVSKWTAFRAWSYAATRNSFA